MLGFVFQNIKTTRCFIIYIYIYIYINIYINIYIYNKTACSFNVLKYKAKHSNIQDVTIKQQNIEGYIDDTRDI